MVLVLFAAAQPGRNPIARVLELRPLVGLGLISYGVYLWHWPISLWLDADSTGLDGVALFAVRAAVTLAVSIASYKLLEMPIRTGRLRIARGRPLLGAAVVVVAVATLLLVPALAFPTSREVPTVRAAGERGQSDRSRLRGQRCGATADRRCHPSTATSSSRYRGTRSPARSDCLAGIVGDTQGVEWETRPTPPERGALQVVRRDGRARRSRRPRCPLFVRRRTRGVCGDWKAPLD